MAGSRLDDLLPNLAPPAAGRAAEDPGASPYAGLDPTRFWRSGVAETHPLTVEGLYARRFPIAPTDRIATAGSCFAQHIAAHLRVRDFKVLDLEKAPWAWRVDPERTKAFGYGIYSARFGNIYTARQLLELLREATAATPPPPIVWERDGRFFDALRPGVEPEGLAAPEEVVAHRRAHLARVRRMFQTLDVFVFTFGLTEAWIDRASGRTLPTCPGTIAGRFDPEAHAFHNFTTEEVLADYRAFHAELAAINPRARHLVTVSPVPLTATAADSHVLLATTYSKSVLRAAAGQLAAEFPDLDYFPSYEIITAPWSRGFFFEPNLRSVSPAGVAAVMRVFFAAHAPEPAAGVGAGAAAGPRAPRRNAEQRREAAEEAVCEEILLELRAVTAAPRRLCVIGNSHVACLKLGGEAGPSNRPPAGLPPVDFFAASANSSAAMRLVETRFLVVPEDSGVGRQFAAVSGGRKRIDLAEYDAFALVGICTQLRDILLFFRSHYLWRHQESHYTTPAC